MTRWFVEDDVPKLYKYGSVYLYKWNFYHDRAPPCHLGGGWERRNSSLVRVSCGGESKRPTLFDFILFTIESPPGAGGDVECEAGVLMDASRY